MPVKRFIHTTLSFDDSLEKYAELNETCYTRGYVYFR
jgi:hypothetical protein